MNSILNDRLNEKVRRTNKMGKNLRDIKQPPFLVQPAVSEHPNLDILLNYIDHHPHHLGSCLQFLR